MHLLPEEKLIWSPIVANSRMNRERNASGINSYEQELGFKPELFLEEKIKQCGKASWMDLCCGAGRALIQTENHFRTIKMSKKVHLEGIDLLNSFSNHQKKESKIKFNVMPILDWQSKNEYNLITCIHGLHYIGDKLKIIELAVDRLTKDGLFIANIDLGNISVKNNKSTAYIKSLFLKNGFHYDGRKKMLKISGNKKVHFGLNYLGADDSLGPNYTGQDYVLSWYSL
ncbi:MAG: methyltransferase domain-containing protein [Ferruginibacter sp.]